MKLSSFDVIVIGGGLVGSSIAYGLARAGTRVAMLDEGDIAHRAARGNFGLIWIQGKGLGLPSYATWTRLSGRRWPELAKALREDTGIDVALAQPGGLHLALSESELDDRARFVERFMSQA